MILLTILLYAATFAAAVWAWPDRHELTPIPIDSERERALTQAMEELDDIDRVVGLLPAKPKPVPRMSQYDRKVWQMQIASGYGWRWE